MLTDPNEDRQDEIEAARAAGEQAYAAEEWGASFTHFTYDECATCGGTWIADDQRAIADSVHHEVRIGVDCMCGEETDGWDPQPPEWEEREVWHIVPTHAQSALEGSDFDRGPHPSREEAQDALDDVISTLEEVNADELHTAGARAAEAVTRAWIDPAQAKEGDGFVELQNGWELEVVRIEGEWAVRKAVKEHTDGMDPIELWGVPVRSVIFIRNETYDHTHGMGRFLPDAIDDANDDLDSGEYTLDEFRVEG